MGKYGRCAEAAVDRIQNGGEDPVTAWKNSARAVFPDSESSQNKGCPKDAFLGLCEAKLLRGVPGGHYTRSVLNKGYALKAVDILKTNPRLSNNEDTFWQAVQGANGKAHNSQMDVVIALWRRDLIER
jgi:hypothetical protein